MREGILMSVGLHVGIVAVAITGLPRLMDPTPLPDSPVIIEVVTVDEGEIEKLEREPEPEPIKPAPEPPAARPEAPKPAPVSVPQPDPIQPVRAAPPPKPVIAVKPPPPVAPKAKPEPAVEPKPEKPKLKKLARRIVAPRRKPPTPDAFEALLRNLDKQRRRRAAQTKVAKAQTETPRLKRPERPVRGAPSGIEHQRVIAALIKNIQDQVRPCWYPPIGAKDAHEIRVGVRIQLNPDGTLIGRPYIVDRDRLFRDPAFQAFAESATRALQNPRCSPLRLPLVNYETWREISFNFDTTELLQ